MPISPIRLPIVLLLVLLGRIPAADWAELPFWPIGIGPEGVDAADKSKQKARILAWIPEGLEHPRAVLLLTNNSDCKDFAQHGAVRETAKRHGMAIVYIRNFSGKGFMPDPEHLDQDGRVTALNAVAEITGKPEFRYAPWIVFGKSSVAQFAIQAPWYWPERTIACILYHGETPSWPVAATAKLKAGQSILHVNMNGETEWGGTWFRHVRPALLNYRATYGLLAHQAIARGVGHGDYVDGAGSPGWGVKHPGHVTCIDVWDYLAAFMDKALTLRLPAEGAPTTGPLTLQTVDEASGVCIDPFAIEEVLRVPHYQLVAGKDGYVLGDSSDPEVTGYAAVPPGTDAIPEGVPVVPVPTGHSPTSWVVTSMVGLIKNDPMTDLAGLDKLRPKPGDTVTIDDKTLTFRASTDKDVGPNGGLKLSPFKQPNKPVTLIAYAVIDVAEPGIYKLRAPFSLAGRLQVVLNGQPVDHRSVIELAKGRYPLLAVLRLNASWGTLEPWFDPVTPEEIALGKSLSGERAKRMAEIEKLRTTPMAAVETFIRPAAGIPPEERKQLMWLPDADLAKRWLALEELLPADR